MIVHPSEGRDDVARSAGNSSRFVAVVGYGSTLEQAGSAAALLRQCGAVVRTFDIGRNPLALICDDTARQIRPRGLLFEALDRPDLALRALRAVRRTRHFEGVGALVAVTLEQIGHVAPSSGFDDFVRYPYVPEELYWRVRGLEWRRPHPAIDSRRDLGRLTIDRAAHEAYVDGASISLNLKEFQLLAHLCDRRGKELSREHLLAQIWGGRYRGNPRTVDVHVCRLRTKLGDAVLIKALRGWGYQLTLAGAGDACSERARRS